MPKITTKPRIVRSRLAGLDWDHDKFGLKPDDLHTTLFDEFNTFQGSLQSPIAFYHDVLEISKKAKNIDELHDMLRQRRQFRLEELNEAAESVLTHLAWNRPHHACEHVDRQNLALSLLISRSLDTLVGYLDSFLREDYKKRYRRCAPEDPYDMKSTLSSASQPAPSESCEPVNHVGPSKGVGGNTRQRPSLRTSPTTANPSQCCEGSGYQAAKSQGMKSGKMAERQSETGGETETQPSSALQTGTTTAETAQCSDECSRQVFEPHRVESRGVEEKRSENGAEEITQGTSSFPTGTTSPTIARCSDGSRHLSPVSQQEKDATPAEKQSEISLVSESQKQLPSTNVLKRKRNAAGEDSPPAQNVQDAPSSKRARQSPRPASTGVVRLVDPNRSVKRPTVGGLTAEGRKRQKIATKELGRGSSAGPPFYIPPEPNFDFAPWDLQLGQESDGDVSLQDCNWMMEVV